MRRPAYAVLPVLGLAWLFHSPFSSAQRSAQSEPIHQFRIVVGLTDSAAKPWQGAITVSGAALDTLSGWRFSQTDRIDPDGKFDFRTKIAALENQLLPGRKFAHTDWADPGMQRLIPQGLIVRTRGADGGRIKFESDSGTFAFSASSVTFGHPISVMATNA